jgi:hypothetical protein
MCVCVIWRIYVRVFIFFQLFVTTNMAVRYLMFLVSIGNAATDPDHMILNPWFSPQLFSGWHREWYWVAHVQNLETPVRYSTKKKRFKQTSAYIAYFKTSKCECTDKPQSTEPTQSVDMFCEFRPSETSMLSLEDFLHVKLSKSLLCTDTKTVT